MAQQSADGQTRALDDVELVRAILAGDSDAFEILMRSHNRRLFRLARAVLRDNAEAEDAVQETYLRAYAALPRFEGRSSLGTWLSRIALRESLRRRRRNERAKIRPDGPDRDTNPDHGPELGALLTAAIDSLPTALRAVLVLRLVEGLSTRQVARTLRLTESNVKVCLHRARRQVAERLQERLTPDYARLFQFGGDRCDRIVSNVLRLVQQPRAQARACDF